MGKIFIFIITILMVANLYPSTKQDNEVFEKIFRNWTNAFNHKNLKVLCNLFSKSLIADYQGAPQKNYSSICNSFEKIFKETNRHYQYSYKIHHVYRSNNLAVVRITWFLQIDENGKITSSQDEGIDIFAKNSKGEWQIVNYLAYGLKHEF